MTWLPWTICVLLAIGVAVVWFIQQRKIKALEATRAELDHELRIQSAHTEQMAWLRAVVEQMAEGVIVTDGEGCVEYSNVGLERLVTPSREEIWGKFFLEVFSPRRRRALVEEMMGTVRDGQPWRGRFPHTRPDGEAIELEASVIPIKNDSGKILHYLTILFDLTHESPMGEQMRRSRSLEAAGVVATELVPSLNNELFTMLGQADVALARLDEEHPARKPQELILEAGQRARDLVRQVVAFSREAEAERAPMVFQDVVEQTLRILLNGLPDAIDLQSDLAATNLQVKTYPAQIHQLLSNLFANSQAALKKTGGTITVRLRRVLLEQRRCELGLRPGDYLCLTVEDNGPGISEKELLNAFDPLYGSGNKRNNHGGMGLTVVKGIVESHRGGMEIQPLPDKGTAVHLYFPILPTGAVSQETEEPPEERRGHERILVVDDETAVMQVICEMLHKGGYQTDGFMDSQQALASFRERPRHYDMIITDYMMRPLDGAAFSREALAIRSTVPILMITAFGQNIRKDEMTTMGVKKVLMKPVLTEDLLDAVGGILSGN